MTKKLNVKVGSVVAFNMLEDATWFDVIAVDGFNMTVREHGTNYAPQRSDVSLVKRVRS